MLFDTRTNEFGVAVTIIFENDMMYAELNMVYNTLCGPGDAQTVQGTLLFKPGQKVEGTASVVGQRLCGENGTASGYSLTLDMPTMKVRVTDSITLTLLDLKVKKAVQDRPKLDLINHSAGFAQNSKT